MNQSADYQVVWNETAHLQNYFWLFKGQSHILVSEGLLWTRILGIKIVHSAYKYQNDRSSKEYLSLFSNSQMCCFAAYTNARFSNDSCYSTFLRISLYSWEMRPGDINGIETGTRSTSVLSYFSSCGIQVSLNPHPSSVFILYPLCHLKLVTSDLRTLIRTGLQACPVRTLGTPYPGVCCIEDLHI